MRAIRGQLVAGPCRPAHVPAPIKLGGRTLWRTQELGEWVASGCPDRRTWDAQRHERSEVNLGGRARSRCRVVTRMEFKSLGRKQQSDPQYRARLRGGGPVRHPRQA